jgi:hypothetical protein
MLSPGQTDYDHIREFFPDVRFILAKGGIGSTFLIRFTDGKIVAAQDDLYGYDEENVKVLYVREF